MVEVGVLGEQFKADNGSLGLSEKPYWQSRDRGRSRPAQADRIVDDGKDG